MSVETMKPEDALKLENQLCFPLYAAARKVTGAYTPLLKPLGITYTQYIVLLVLWEKDGQTVGAIGDLLHLDNGTLTPLFKKMETEGIVTRLRSKEDERRVTIQLTEKGKALKKQAEGIPAKIGACIHLNQEDARSLYRILYQILDD